MPNYLIKPFGFYYEPNSQMLELDRRFEDFDSISLFDENTVKRLKDQMKVNLDYMEEIKKAYICKCIQDYLQPKTTEELVKFLNLNANETNETFRRCIHDKDYEIMHKFLDKKDSEGNEFLFVLVCNMLCHKIQKL
jgi:hypothetical protein